MERPPATKTSSFLFHFFLYSAGMVLCYTRCFCDQRD